MPAIARDNQARTSSTELSVPWWFQTFSRASGSGIHSPPTTNLFSYRAGAKRDGRLPMTAFISFQGACSARTAVEIAGKRRLLCSEVNEHELHVDGLSCCRLGACATTATFSRDDVSGADWTGVFIEGASTLPSQPTQVQWQLTSSLLSTAVFFRASSPWPRLSFHRLCLCDIQDASKRRDQVLGLKWLLDKPIQRFVFES